MNKISPKSWFETLFGVTETKNAIKENFTIHEKKKGIFIESKANQKIFYAGKFECVSLSELKEQLNQTRQSNHQSSKRGDFSSIKHIAVGDIFEEHYKNPNAMFMAASQFNCLEFASPHATPEDGITIYQYDRTQGPACALACAPSTLYRNYFVPLPKNHDTIQIGQSADLQINILKNLENFLGEIYSVEDSSPKKKQQETKKKYWEITNGYMDSTPQQLHEFDLLLLDDQKLWDKMKNLVQVGLLTDAEVVFSSRETIPWHLASDVSEKQKVFVSQVYCSAIACGYSENVHDIFKWKNLAIMLLEAQYEAVLLAAALEGKKVFLTILGGGVFQNKTEWIASAMAKALAKTCYLGLEIYICHYKSIDESFMVMVNEFFKLEMSY